MPTAKETVQARIDKVRSTYEPAEDVQIRVSPEELIELTERSCPEELKPFRDLCQSKMAPSHVLMRVREAAKLLADTTPKVKPTDGKS